MRYAVSPVLDLAFEAQIVAVPIVQTAKADSGLVRRRTGLGNRRREKPFYIPFPFLRGSGIIGQPLQLK